MTGHEVTEPRLAGWLAQSTYLGADCAMAVATWVDMSESDARSILGDVDPAVLDAIGAPNLSGEYADDVTPASLVEDIGLTRDELTICPDGVEIREAIAAAWEAGRDLLWGDALAARALRVLGDVARACEVEQRNEHNVDVLREVAGL